MKQRIPDYFIALVKQHANMLNDDQTVRAISATGRILEAGMQPGQANAFFAAVPSYLRPTGKTFFSRVGDWQPQPKQRSIVKHLIASLGLTGAEEAETLLQAYFMAIRTVIDSDTALRLARTLPTDVARLYSRAGQ